VFELAEGLQVKKKGKGIGWMFLMRLGLWESGEL
jgi:hypothetical protein